MTRIERHFIDVNPIFEERDRALHGLLLEAFSQSLRIEKLEKALAAAGIALPDDDPNDASFEMWQAFVKKLTEYRDDGGQESFEPR